MPDIKNLININTKTQKNSRVNPWEDLFDRGIPTDLQNPYAKFDKILNFLKENDCNRVLDVAMGAGRHSIALATENFEVFGFDLSKKALKIAGKLFKEKKLKGSFCCADMFERYPYNSNFFDGVIAIQAIYHGKKSEMTEALKEIARILKPRGAFSFSISTNKKRPLLGSHNPNGIKKLDEKTFIPLSGREKGLIHYYPEISDIIDMLSTNFDEVKIDFDIKNDYYVVFCKKRLKG